MNDDERALRDAFLSECWKPVREWHPTADEKAAAWARNESLNASTACAESGGKSAA